jgi:hypothetical protein
MSAKASPSVAGLTASLPAQHVKTATFEPLRKPAWYAISLLILTFFFWTATSSNRAFHPRDTAAQFYNQLTSSILHGHLYLAEKPSAQLLALPDPYEPDANEKLRLHDASLYRGRYYLYFGIAPVLTLYLPWRVITGASVSDDVAVTIFSMAGYVFSCLLLFLLLEAAHLRPPWFLQAAAVVALGLGQSAPIILRRPRVYEVAVSAAYCFLLGGLYFLARRVLKPEAGRWCPALAAVFLGLAVASRPHCALAALAALAFYAFHLKRALRLHGRSWLMELAVFAIPLGIAALLIAWYNYARFDDPFEFGIHYQLSVINWLKEYRLGTPLSVRLHDILASAYYFLICVPDFLPRFPFFELSPSAQPFGDPDLLPRNYFHEPVASMLLIAPIIIAGLALPFSPWKQKLSVRTILGVLSVSGVAMFLGVCTLPSASARFGLDCIPALTIVGLFACLWLYSRLPAGKMRIIVAGITMAGSTWSVALNAALSVNSYGYPLEQPRSTTFRSIASFFGAGPDAFMDDVNSLHLDSMVIFPRAKPGTQEALLGSGIYERWNLLVAQYQPNDAIIFSYVYSAVSYVASPPIPVRLGVPQRLRVDYSVASRRIVVRLDDRTVLDFRTEFWPTSRDRVMIGRMRAGRFWLRDFSGQIKVAPGGLQVDLRHVIPSKIFTSSPAVESLTPVLELMNYDLDWLATHTEHNIYGKLPENPPLLPEGVFRATSGSDHFATRFQPIAIGSSPVTAVELDILGEANPGRLGSINMSLQDQDYRTLYSSGTLPDGADQAVVALPAGSRALRLAFVANDEGYIVLPKSVRLRVFTKK